MLKLKSLIIIGIILSSLIIIANVNKSNIDENNIEFKINSYYINPEDKCSEKALNIYKQVYKKYGEGFAHIKYNLEYKECLLNKFAY